MRDEHPPFQLLVTRSMSLATADGTRKTAHVDFGKPYLIPATDPDHDPNWGCQFRMRGFAKDESHAVYGVDGVQALYLTLSLAGVRIAAQPESPDLDWAAVPHFGFPPIVEPLPDQP